ncbi:thioesterase II family protein [Streptosporangium sp. NPDC001559]|uniref:thioesterase II family protein n=1 Tax=Streptosporangium sp. NPDC001559 TaxID=3366187 RepID=UPI0036DFF763
MPPTNPVATSERQFHAINPCPRPNLRLVCFPHSGGSAGYFRTWKSAVPEGVELLAVRYPGREERLCDPFAEDMRELADSIAHACARFDDAPLAFFGHSLGSLVAYEVAVRLSARYGVTLRTLFASSCAAPWLAPRLGLGDAADEALIERVGQLGGTDMSVFDNLELRELIMPAIRADYRLLDRYTEPATTALDCPVHVYHGTDDPGVGADAVAAWSRATARAFSTRAFPGGHFYLAEHLPELARDLFARLETPPAGRPSRSNLLFVLG